MRATTQDHFVPVSVAASLADLVDIKLNKVLLPACRECNCLAGAKLFKTFGAKKRYIRERLRKRYARFLAAPEWSEAELETLGWTLRTEIERTLMIKHIVQARLSRVHSAELASVRAVRGNGSIPKLAEKHTTASKPPSPAKHGQSTKQLKALSLGKQLDKFMATVDWGKLGA